jgi:hypothetical protein
VIVIQGRKEERRGTRDNRNGEERIFSFDLINLLSSHLS